MCAGQSYVASIMFVLSSNSSPSPHRYQKLLSEEKCFS